MSVQVPGFDAHSSHFPAQGVSQQKLSTQLPEVHWFAPVQAVPFCCLGTQAPPEQYEEGEHWASTVQAPGQPAFVPSQAYGIQEGFPAAPRAAILQVPGVVAHSSHAPAHAVLQQKPSAQKPDVHSLFAPQAAASAFFGWQFVPSQ
jgi:hypothetical protein